MNGVEKKLFNIGSGGGFVFKSIGKWGPIIVYKICFENRTIKRLKTQSNSNFNGEFIWGVPWSIYWFF
jgi:hypothetical protein